MRKNTLNFSSLYVANDLDIIVGRSTPIRAGNGGPPPLPDNTKDNTFVSLKNIGFSLEHQVNRNSTLTTESFITYSKFDQNFYNELAPPGDVIASSSYKNVINNLSLKTTTSKRFKNKNILDLGAEVTDYEVLGNRTTQNPNNTSIENDAVDGRLYSLYSNFLIKNTNPLTIKLGLRSTYYSLKEKKRLYRT